MSKKKIAKLKDFTPDDLNSNKHTELGGSLMETSIQECGIGDSMTADKNGLMISGNQRLETMMSLGLDKLDPIIIESDGTRPVIHVRTDLDLKTDKRARLLSVFQNRVGELNLDWDIKNLVAGLSREELTKALFSDAELTKMLADLEAGSSGKLLDLVNVTIKEPRHEVEKGDRWELGKHVLWCAEVLTGWEHWKPELEGKTTVFAPYPGPFVALTMKAKKAKRIVMVQPDPYICGHILDRWADIYGEKEIHRGSASRNKSKN